MAKLDGNGDGGRRLGLDFGRFWARTHSWRVGVGGRRGCAARGATNRGGRRAVAGATNGGDSARLGLHELEDGDGREGRDGVGRFEGVREDKGADAEVGRDCRRVEAAPTSTVAGMAGKLHSAEQEIHCFFV